MSNVDFRGAESKLYLQDWLGSLALFKKRIPKTYRIKELDSHFRKQRTIYEARLLVKAKEAGVRVPIIFEIDVQNTTLVLEYIEGEILKTFLPKVELEKRLELCRDIGSKMGLLHKKGIIHGDLTTSNIIQIKETNQLAFIDFGLGYFSEKHEDFGVDVYLLERSMQSTHPEFFNETWKEVITGYKVTSPFRNEIERKIDEINTRGRYSDRLI